jgi:hypothetical protein
VRDVSNRLAALPRENQDAVRRQHQLGGVTEVVRCVRLGEDATAVPNRLRIHPVLVHVAVEDLAPLASARGADRVVRRTSLALAAAAARCGDETVTEEVRAKWIPPSNLESCLHDPVWVSLARELRPLSLV